MARHFLSKKDTAALILRLKDFGISANLEDGVEIEQRKEGKFYLYKGKPLAFETVGFYPSLQALNLFHPSGKWIVVDDGAIPHLTNGANLFGKGIVDLDRDIAIGDTVFVRNSEGIYFAIMKAVKTYGDLAKDRTGEFAIMIHRPGDKAYSIFMEISR